MKYLAFALLLFPLGLGAVLPPEQVEFFEKRIRPVLAQECYECHSSTGKRKGGLALDSRPAWQEGGETGAAIVPGEVKESLLLRSIRHEDPELQMPRHGAKLDAPVIRDFERWVAMGAPDPRDQPPTPAELAKDKEWASVLQRRTNWWSFQPLAHPPVPPATAWSAQPIDRFLLERMTAGGLSPAAEAEPRLVLRRLSYVLSGLPPTPAEAAAFESEARQDLQGATERAADRLLASSRFGETWARHWMDWVRYAESHGSEGDPAIPFAWRYRDYLVRALNADVPFPQLLREHIAGDLLEQPRLDPERRINESALGAAHYRMVLHGFTPTDALDEQATFTDNQIDTVSKTFLGLTVACARCHNHKFDAISQADYYALYGIFASCRPATVDVNWPAGWPAAAAPFAAAKEKVRHTLAEAWLSRLSAVPERLGAWTLADAQARAVWVAEGMGPLAAWLELKDLPLDQWPKRWADLRKKWAGAEARLAQFRAQKSVVRWDLRGPDFTAWQSSGPGVAQGPQPAGAFAVEGEGDRVLAGIYPAGVYSHLFSDREAGVLASPRFTAEGGKLWLRVRGGGEARARYVVRNYPRTGTVYPKLELNSGEEQWVAWDLDYWKGDTLHLEITTDEDQPVETKKKDRSWFGVSEAVYVGAGETPAPPRPGASLVALVPAAAPGSVAELAALYTAALRGCVEHWEAGTMSDLEADFLSAALGIALLPNRLSELPSVAPAVAACRAAADARPVPTRAPGLLEGYAFDQPLFTRGDHKHPAEPVPRRFLEALDARPYPGGERESGRRQLAESLLAPSNPLTPRVMVNRLWQYVFGEGLVATPDNFGRLGEAPSHPELLDYLAAGFQEQGGSLKGFLRQLVTSRAFRVSYLPSGAAAERDPQNRLLSHFSTRRLDAEAIRDSMLALTGKLDETSGGEPAGGNAYRRSLYVRVVRNSLDPFLSAFDFPVPSATRGRRDATNVPAQALALLNNPVVATWATDWTRHLLGDPGLLEDRTRVERMFQEAFTRPPRPDELSGALDFLEAAEPVAEGKPAVPKPWPSLAQAIFNAKEFIYLH